MSTLMTLGQVAGNATNDWNKARQQLLAEQQSKQELDIRRQQMARSLQLEMIRLQIEKARQTAEEGRFSKEVEIEKQREWRPLKDPVQNPDGTWSTFEYNVVTGESRVRKLPGTPLASVIQGQKGDTATDVQGLKNQGALDLERLRGRDKLGQIAASGRWHTRWAEIAAQGKLKKEDWQALRTDPGYIKAVGEMRANLGARNRILSMMYSATNPPTPSQMAELNKQLQEVDQQLEQSSKAAEQVRNRVRFGPVPDLSALKNLVGSQVKQRTVKIGGKDIPVMADNTFTYQGQKYKMNADGTGGTLVTGP